MTRIRVVGGGIAGVLLAWRLAGHAEVDVFLGKPGKVDATRVSGGFVRGWEPDRAQRRLALDSLSELLTDERLQQWSRYTQAGCVVAAEDLTTIRDAAEEIDRHVPGSVELLSRHALAGYGWRGLPPRGGALFERRAGHLDLHALRHAILADLRGRRSVDVLAAAAPASPTAEITVIAAGAWTPSVLASLGQRTAPLRTKAIEYTVYQTGGWRPLPFIDTMTGLYGRPTPTGLLLGLPTQDWDVTPGASLPSMCDRAGELATQRFPQLDLHGKPRRVRASDCYAPDGQLRLRPVTESLYTFTGGSGGAAKTALAASRLAAQSLLGSSPAPSGDLAGGLR